MTPPRTTKLQFDGNGWVGYASADAPHSVSVHLSQTPAGRWVIDILTVAVGGTGTGPFPTGRLTARELRSVPLGKIEVWVNQLVSQGLADPIKGKLSDTVQFGDPVLGTVTWVDKLPPAGKRAKGDEFYRRVGEIYGKAAVASTRPAADLATIWEVPVTTVHRWIREARRRGHLPPAEPGRRG
jgi:hypothetical protein